MDNIIDFGSKADEKKSETWTADETLRRAIGQFPIVVVLGVDKSGELAFITNKHDYMFMQWALSKASLELHLHEKGLNNASE